MIWFKDILFVLISWNNKYMKYNLKLTYKQDTEESHRTYMALYPIGVWSFCTNVKAYMGLYCQHGHATHVLKPFFNAIFDLLTTHTLISAQSCNLVFKLQLVYFCLLPASVAQLDAPSNWRPGGRGFNPCQGRQHSFVEIDHEIFSTVILSLPLIQEGQLSVSGERMCTILVNRLED